MKKQSPYNDNLGDQCRTADCMHFEQNTIDKKKKIQYLNLER